jgi:hypothetical protein
MTMILRIAALLLPHRVRVIKSNQTLPISPMQRKRVIQSVRLLCRHRNSRNHKPDPVPTLGVHYQRESVQIEQRV